MRNQQGETMSEAIGTMTSRGACRAMARRMRHGGAGKHARGKAVPYETYKKIARHPHGQMRATGIWENATRRYRKLKNRMTESRQKKKKSPRLLD